MNQWHWFKKIYYVEDKEVDRCPLIDNNQLKAIIE